MLLDSNFNYIYSVSNANMHNGIEENLKEGVYYLVSDVNYRYANPNKKNFSYVVTCYSQTALNLENVTADFDLTNVIQTAIYSYCRTYVPPTKCSNGVYLYRAATNMDSIPFETAIFENYTEKDFKVKLNVVGKGEKSFCFYNDEIASEADITAVKELPKNSVAIFTVLKYGNSSIFNFKYFFAPLKSPNPNNPTALRAPKIYDEEPKIQEAQPNTEANVQQPQGPVPEQIPEQNQNIQQNQEVNIETNKVVQQNEVKEIQNVQMENENKIQETELQTKDNRIQTTEQNVQTTQTEIKEEKIATPNIESIQVQQVKVVKKKGGHPVFQTQGQIIDEYGTLVQYYLDSGDDLVIGLENKSNTKLKMQLVLEGALITNTGKSFAVFYSNPRERKIFKTKKIQDFGGEITFQFQYV